MQWCVLHVQSVCFLRIFSFLSLLYCCAELASSVTTQKNVHYATILCSPEKTKIWWKTRDKIEVRRYRCRGSNHKIKQAKRCHSALYTLVIYRLINLTAKYLFLSQKTFNYSSTLWSNEETLNLNGGKTGFDSQETKLPSNWTTSFSKICLGMKIGSAAGQVYCQQRAGKLVVLSDRWCPWAIPQYLAGSRHVEVHWLVLMPPCSTTVTRKGSMLLVVILANLKQESVSLVTMKKIARPVTLELGLALEEILIKPTHVETRLSAVSR